MDLVHFTDPACPYAFSAEPRRLCLRWHYGDQLRWRTRLVVLSSSQAQLEAAGTTAAGLAAVFRRLQREHGMPLDTRERSRVPVARPACSAVVATRLHRDEATAEALLRRLRVRGMGGELIDEEATIARAARDVGIDPEELRGWIGEPATDAALDEDMAAARRPLPPARVLDHKLGASEDGGRRYTCPSYELHADDSTAVLPGFQPWESYDVTVVNLEPSIERRDPPEDVGAVLDWAEHPLASAEVAALLGLELAAAREQLSRAGARFEPVGADGYWSAS